MAILRARMEVIVNLSSLLSACSILRKGFQYGSIIFMRNDHKKRSLSFNFFKRFDSILLSRSELVRVLLFVEFSQKYMTDLDNRPQHV